MKQFVALALVFTSFGCDGSVRFSGPVGTVTVAPREPCAGALVTVATPEELQPPWSGGPSSEFGLMRTLYDGGVLIRQVLMTVRDDQWTVTPISPRITVRSMSSTGTLCGWVEGDAGTTALALEYLDGGLLIAPDVHESCVATEGGWWTAWSYPHVLRGRNASSESVGSVDGGVAPGVPSGTVPWVLGVREDGEVLILINNTRPGAWLLPSRVELKSPTGYAAPIGFAGPRPYGLNAGPVLREPLVWDDRGDPTRLATGDGGEGYVQTVDLRGHSDGHFCGSVELDGVPHDVAAFWKRDGGFVSPKAFATLDSGITPVTCAPIGRDWFYVTHLEGEPAVTRSALLQLKLECLPF